MIFLKIQIGAMKMWNLVHVAYVSYGSHYLEGENNFCNLKCSGDKKIYGLHNYRRV